MTMTNNKTTTIIAIFFDKHLMIVDFQSCQNGPSFSVAAKLFWGWLIVVSVAHNHHTMFSDERSIMDIQFYWNTLLFSMAAKSKKSLSCCWLLLQSSVECG
jgi:hypothetical protein